MKPEAMLELLENVAEQLGIRVSYELLQSSVVTGGLCKVKGAYRVIIDKKATSEERVSTLATALASFPAQLEEIAIPPKVRELLRLHEPSGKNRRTAA
jgi:hypothetical protein